MTRLAFGLDGWEPRELRGRRPLTAADAPATRQTRSRTPGCGTTGRCGDTLDQLQTVRQYYDFVDVDTTATSSTATSARSCCRPASSPSPRRPSRHELGQHRDHLHPRHRRWRWCRSTRSSRQGQPRLWIRDLPPVSTSGAPEITQPRIYFGETVDRLRHGRRPAGRVRLPAGPASGTPAPTPAPSTAGPATPASSSTRRWPAPVRAPVPRPRPADQRPDHRRQPAPVPPLARRPPAADRAVPALRQGPVPGRADDGRTRLHPGRLHDQRPLPERRRRSSRTSDLESTDLGRRAVQLHPQQRQGHDRRLRRHDDLLRGRSDRSASSAPGRASFPALFQPIAELPARPDRPPPRARGAVQRPDADVRPLPRHRPADVLPQRRTCGRSRPARRNEQTPPVRGLLRGHADARRGRRRVPAPPADDRPPAGRT